MENKYRSHAEILIEKGFSVVPVYNKAPKFQGWSEIREEQILNEEFDRYWRDCNGLGILCGEVSGIVCLDIDIYEDDIEKAELRKQILSMLPPVYCGMIGNPKKPPSRLFRFNGEENKRFSSIGVDIISNGGQKVLPPSFNNHSQTYYQWVGFELYDIDADDLPVIPKELLDFLYAKAGHGNSWVENHKEITLTPAPGRCNHNSHDYISQNAVKQFYKGLGFESLLSYVLNFDKEINKDADFYYFSCPSRSWKSPDESVNAMSFVAELIKNHATKRGNAQLEAVGNVPVLDLYSLDLKLAPNGRPFNTISNIEKIFKADKNLSGSVWFDDFHQKYLTNSNADGSKRIREWEDDDDLRVTAYMQSVLGLNGITDDKVFKARVLYCQNHRKNEPRDWIGSLSWDGKSRVDRFFSEYMGAEDNDYTRAVSKNFWVSMVARVFRPGCKVDNMVILEGEQGSKKSTALSVIGGKWYVDCNEDMKNKDFYQVTWGSILVEIGELASLRRTGDVNQVKKILSTSVDRVRTPYSRSAKDFPRKCIFVGTTNEDEYIQDSTGNRRFWPIRVGLIKLENIKRDRTQLFAEAYSKFARGEKWFEVPESAKIEQDMRVETDPWTDEVASFLSNPSRIRKFTSVDELLGQALMIDIDKKNHNHSRRVCSILKRLGYKKSKLIRISGNVIRCYAKQLSDFY